MAGKPVEFLLISKDITAEIQLTQYARSLIEASLDPLATISAEGKITDVNAYRSRIARRLDLVPVPLQNDSY